MKKFVFLHPIPEIMDFEIEYCAFAFHKFSRYNEFLKRKEAAQSESEKQLIMDEALEAIRLEYREVYASKLNECIDLRYRTKGFIINYVIFNGHAISDIIDLRTSDNVIEVGLDFKTHTTEQPDGTFIYPNPDFVLGQLGETSKLVIAGFHSSDCVDKLARRAYDRGLNVLVDEDLTERFHSQLRRPSFRSDIYPSVNPRTFDDEMGFKMFMEYRKDRPWLWQQF